MIGIDSENLHASNPTEEETRAVSLNAPFTSPEILKHHPKRRMPVINDYCPQRVISVLNNIVNSSGILLQNIWLLVEASSKLSGLTTASPSPQLK